MAGLQKAVLEFPRVYIAYLLQAVSTAGILQSFAYQRSGQAGYDGHVLADVRQMPAVVKVGVGKKNTLNFHFPVPWMGGISFPYARVFKVGPVLPLQRRKDVKAEKVVKAEVGARG